MNTPDNLQFKESEHNIGSTRHIDIECEVGFIDLTYNSVGMLGIANIVVDAAHRRQGIGKMLLDKARSKAEELDASMVYAAIISRECLDAMQAVFGEDCIQVHKQGQYSNGIERPADYTEATLWWNRK